MVPKAPLVVSLPLVEAHFEHIEVNLVGPLEKLAAGYKHVLVILDNATHNPEAIPLRSMSAHVITEELLKVFSWIGIPQEILNDQVTSFMPGVMRELCRLLKICSFRSSVYHPQRDDRVERFNKTLKEMIHQFSLSDVWNWDNLLPPIVLFHSRSATGFYGVLTF